MAASRYLYVDLFLKGHFKIRIISLYIHANCNDKTSAHHRRLLQKEILHLLDDSAKQYFNIIIMGDFNVDLDLYQQKLKTNKPV